MEDLETFDGFPDDQDLPDIPAVPGTADPAPSQCWGGELSGDATHCTPGFVPGSNHLKSKWCAHCTQFGIVVAASRVRAIGTELHGTLTNGRGSGMYMHLPVQPADAAQPARAPPRYRLINQTKDCRGPRMVVFENPTPPPELEDLWSPMPPGVVRDGERVHLKLGQGTIIPVLPPGATLGGPSREGSTSRSSPSGLAHQAGDAADHGYRGVGGGDYGADPVGARLGAGSHHLQHHRLTARGCRWQSGGMWCTPTQALKSM